VKSGMGNKSFATLSKSRVGGNPTEICTMNYS